MSFGKGLLAAVSGFTQGVADAAVREDKARADMTKEAFSQAMRSREAALKLANEQKTLRKEQDAFIEAFANTQIGDNIMSRAEAFRLYQVTNGDYTKVNDAIEDGLVKVRGVGELVESAPAAGWQYTPVEGSSADKESSYLFGKRGKAVDAAVREQMKAAGATEVKGVGTYSVKGLEAPTLTPTGDIETDVMYVTGLDGVGGMVTRVETTISGKRTTTYEDMAGRDITETMLKGITDGAVEVSNTAPNVRAAVAFRKNKDGTIQPVPMQVGVNSRGTFYTKDDKGNFSKPITDNDLIILPASVVADMGGINAAAEAFDLLGKDGRKAFGEYHTAAEGMEGLMSIMGQQVDLLNQHGNKLVSDVGGISEFVEYVGTEFGVAIEFVDGKADLGSAAANAQQYIARAQAGGMQDLAVARKVFAANQIILAYNFAKSTGDTRISNQDFDAFIKTVSAGNVTAQRELYRSRLSQARDFVASKFSTLNSYVKQGGEDARTVIDNLPEERTVSGLSTKADQLLNLSEGGFKTVEETVKAGTAYNAVPVYIDDKGETVDSGAPNARELYTVRTPSGELLKIGGNVVTLPSKEEAEKFIKNQYGDK